MTAQSPTGLSAAFNKLSTTTKRPMIFTTTTTDQNLWETILWATTDPDQDGDCLDRHYGLSDVDSTAIAQLNQQFWAWREQLDDVLISNGLKHHTPEDIAGHTRLEHVYALVRDGHGVSFTDGWRPGTREHRAAGVMNQLARAQGEIGAYPGDDGAIHCSWSV
jgi:hypothetical protein